MQQPGEIDEIISPSKVNLQIKFRYDHKMGIYSLFDPSGMFGIKYPNGIVNADQIPFYADSVEKYGEQGDIIDINACQY